MMSDKCERCIHRNVCADLYCYQCDSGCCDECGFYCVVDKDNIDNCDNFVDKTDVAEVKHGEWIAPTQINGRTFNIPHCSVCEYVPCDKGKFCPNCGADMRGINNE